MKQLREILESGELTADVLREAEKLEGSVRGVGIHAAGIIIAPSDLSDILPVCTTKDSPMLVTQYDGKVVEDAGAIKMDFLGLKDVNDHHVAIDRPAPRDPDRHRQHPAR